MKVLTGSRYCGKAADCWSVGFTLFTMLAGFSPATVDYPSAVHEAKVGKGMQGRGRETSRETWGRRWDTHMCVSDRATCVLPTGRNSNTKLYPTRLKPVTPLLLPRLCCPSGTKKAGGYDHYFQFPAWICPLACSLLKGIMEPDAEKRYTIAEIRSHPWFAPKRFSGTSDLGERGSIISSSSSYRTTRSTSSTSSTSSTCSTSTCTSDAEESSVCSGSSSK